MGGLASKVSASGSVFKPPQAAKKTLKDLIKEEEIKAKEEDLEKGRLIWAIIGEQKSGRSQTLGKLGFMNLKFADEEWFPEGVKSLLKQGVIPEVERVLLLDSENAWKRKILKFKATADLFKPLMKEGRLIVLSTIQRDERKRKRLNPEKSREYTESLITQLISLGDEGTALGIDTMTDYYKHLNMEMRHLLGKGDIQKTMKPGQGKDEGIFRPFWQWRNLEWEATMKDLADVFGHVVCSFKAGRAWDEDAHDYSDDPRDIKPLWATGTESWIDEAVWLYLDVKNSKPVVDYEFKFITKKNGGTYPPKKYQGVLQNDRGSFLQLYDSISHNFL